MYLQVGFCVGEIPILDYYPSGDRIGKRDGNHSVPFHIHFKPESSVENPFAI